MKEKYSLPYLSLKTRPPLTLTIASIQLYIVMEVHVNAFFCSKKKLF